jgi:hypothetical protein
VEQHIDQHNVLLNYKQINRHEFFSSIYLPENPFVNKFVCVVDGIVSPAPL